MMTNSDGLRFKPERGSSPLKEDDENVTVVSRSVQHKMAKFKSPLSSAFPPITDDRILPSGELSPQNRSDGLRKRAFGTDASNVPPPVESRNHVHTPQKKFKRFCEEQSPAMPGFSSILEDIYQICPEVEVKIEPPDDMLGQEKTVALQPNFQNPEAGNTATPGSKPSGITLEKHSDKEGDEATVDLRMETHRPSANAVRRIAATNRSCLYSKFKVPARVGSVCEAQEVSQMTPSLPGALVRPQLFRTPYKLPTASITTARANERRSTAEEKITSDYYCVMYCIRKPNAKNKGPWSDGVLIRRGRSSILQDTEGKLVLKDGEQRGGALTEGDILLVIIARHSRTGSRPRA